MAKILVTGSAGFIGFHLVKRLIEGGEEVIGLDSINDYYSVDLKYARLEETGINRNKVEYKKFVYSSNYENYRFVKLNLEDRVEILDLCHLEKFDTVVNLGAQAGVRYSIQNPYAYIDSNIVGFINILEGCRQNEVKHLVYASSSSVYGLNESMPFSTHHNVDHPISLYAASKKSNELMAHTYSYLYKIPTTGLRFFTVYGPWGRPDMAVFLFTKAIIEGKPIKIYNRGNLERDFTYIDDIVNSIIRLLDIIPESNRSWSGLDPDPASSPAPYKIYNIGNNSPVKLMDFVNAIELELGTEAIKEYLPMQAGDVPVTWADVESLFETINYKPGTSITSGIIRFIEWYREYHNIT